MLCPRSINRERRKDTSPKEETTKIGLPKEEEGILEREEREKVKELEAPFKEGSNGKVNYWIVHKPRPNLLGICIILTQALSLCLV